MNGSIKIINLLILIISNSFLFAQTSLNVTLFGQNNRGDVRYSGSWSYIAPDGTEYALLGARTGLAAYTIDDATNINEVGFIPGPSSNWREITVVKNHAYVTTEGSGVGQGLQVVDLSYLPDSLHLVTTYDATFTRGHILQSDIYNPSSDFIYVCGTASEGFHIIDVSVPSNPVEVALYAPYYIHDLHVRGDRIYAAALYESAIDVIDISNKANPTLITQISYQGGFTHSSWTTQDNTHLLVTDEIDGLKMNIWNIEDINNVYTVADWSANLQSLVHNPYVRGDFAFIAHNTEGLRVLDVVDPALPVEVGFYDTYAGASGGFNGLWSACPFFPSNKIIGGNRADGLYVWEFNDTHAGRVYGRVLDGMTGLIIPQAEITISGSAETLYSTLDGDYKWGNIPGSYTVTCSKTGYYTKVLPALNLLEGDSLIVDIELWPNLVGNDDFTASNQVSITPNPFTDFLVIEGLEDSNFPLFLELFTADGRLLATREVNSNTIQLAKLATTSQLLFYVLKDTQKQIISTGKLVHK